MSTPHQGPAAPTPGSGPGRVTSAVRRVTERFSRWRNTRRGTATLKAAFTQAARDAKRMDPTVRERIGRANMTKADLQQLAEAHITGAYRPEQRGIAQQLSDRATARAVAADSSVGQTRNPIRRVANRVSRWRNTRQGTATLKAAYAQAARDVQRMDPTVRERIGQSRITKADLQNLAQVQMDRTFRPEGRFNPYQQPQAGLQPQAQAQAQTGPQPQPQAQAQQPQARAQAQQPQARAQAQPRTRNLRQRVAQAGRQTAQRITDRLRGNQRPNQAAPNQASAWLKVAGQTEQSRERNQQQGWQHPQTGPESHQSPQNPHQGHGAGEREGAAGRLNAAAVALEGMAPAKQAVAQPAGQGQGAAAKPGTGGRHRSGPKHER